MKRFRIQNASGAVLYTVLGITLLVVGLFFLGGETPEAQRLVWDLSKEEPLYTDALMYWMYGLLCLAVLLVLGTALYKFSVRWAVSPREAVRPLLGAALLGCVLAVSWMAGSDRPMDMPGYDGTENVPFWLKLADMFLYTIYVLLAVAVLLIAGFGIARKAGLLKGKV